MDMNELMNDVAFCQWRHAAIDYASHNNYFDDLIYIFRQCTLNSPSICKNAPGTGREGKGMEGTMGVGGREGEGRERK